MRSVDKIRNMISCLKIVYVFVPDSQDVVKLMMSLDRGQGAVNLIYCPEVKYGSETFSQGNHLSQDNFLYSCNLTTTQAVDILSKRIKCSLHFTNKISLF